MLTNHAQLDAKWELKIEQNEDHTCIYYEFGITTKKLHDQWFRKMGLETRTTGAHAYINWN